MILRLLRISILVDGILKRISEEFESEDTLSILNRYIEEADVNLDKSVIQKMMQEVYQEACEIDLVCLF